VSRRVEANQPQRILEICEALLGKRIHTKALPAPFRDWMQRRAAKRSTRSKYEPSQSTENGTPR
jgi:hypothetical protein